MTEKRTAPNATLNQRERAYIEKLMMSWAAFISGQAVLRECSALNLG
jgi:hypothetical protein